MFRAQCYNGHALADVGLIVRTARQNMLANTTAFPAGKPLATPMAPTLPYLVPWGFDVTHSPDSAIGRKKLEVNDRGLSWLLPVANVEASPAVGLV